MRVSGWVFDIFPEPRGMTLWLLDAEGRMHRFLAPFAPSFFLAGGKRALRAAVRLLVHARAPVEVRAARRKEFYSDREVPVLEVKVRDPLRYPPIVRLLQRRLPELEFFTCDIDTECLFFYQSGLFPLARVEVEADGESRLRAWELRDDPWALDYSLPPLSVMELGLEGTLTHPKQSRTLGALSIRVEGRDYLIEPGFEARELSRLLHVHDPHLVVTDWGDDFLLEELAKLPGFEKVPFNRDGAPLRRRGRARSYFTYGKVMYAGPSYFLRGRWHVDRENSFILHETGLEGLFELARLSKTPLQKVARQSTGSVISAMQLEVALRDGYLIPWRKATVEEPKTAEELLTIDKGGLVYQPRPGLYGNVAEIDFSSMYPTLMERFNLSPETVNCPCCASSPEVPEAGYHTCKRRVGLVPKTIAPLLKKRAAYKGRMRRECNPSLREVFDRRQTAIKWLLVTCFGYLGYKNARFGKIEAHESTTALGREMLLRAKEVA